MSEPEFISALYAHASVISIDTKVTKMTQEQAKIAVDGVLGELEAIVSRPIETTDARVLKDQGLVLVQLGKILADGDIIQAGQDAFALGKALD